ncbi:substrate-binding domain-containing protein [Marivita sp.]|uniref:substrate-binding domain-containing protein n=1 Tax=Marivita sp. TaxID=2003365 RepID=UPI0025BDC60C|nr:substrate-binding domain-containing protein [Marivita sp.]
MFRSLIAAVFAVTVTPAKAQNVSLLAAGSPKAALTDVVTAFTEATGTPITSAFGPSGPMRERIEAGETAHVFATANMRHP